MYSVDSQDRVIKLNDVPQPDVGAPQPLVLSDERVTLLAYSVQRKPYPFDGGVLTEADMKLSGEQVALVEFRSCHSFMFGAPNDEACGGHPLADRGLSPYGVFEIENSSWIRQLEKMNSVHSQHEGGWLLTLKHFIFAFHDSTFECVASGLSWSLHSGSLEALLAEMRKRLQ